MTAASEVLATVRISDVCQALTSFRPKRSGKDTHRTVATWRNGDGWSVSLDDSRGVWHDFVSGEGGGVLDLVILIRGGSRQDALRWLACFAGVELIDSNWTAEDHARWVRQKDILDRELPAAQYWRRAAVSLAEDLLDNLKAALFAPTEGPIVVGEVANLHRLLESLQRMEGETLVAEYCSWRDRYPQMTAAMVRSAKERENVQKRALTAYLMMLPEIHAYSA